MSESLATIAEQSPDGVITGFMGWKMTDENILEGAVKNKGMLFELDF